MPMELLQIASFREMLFQSRNAEEALLVILNACARTTRKVSDIEHFDPTAFGAWFKRIQGQRSGAESVLAADCLSFLNLSWAKLVTADLYGANLAGADLSRADLEGANLAGANLEGANLEGARRIKRKLP
jgi:uncharacterized protein YjbI with pentapeptide repeats